MSTAVLSLGSNLGDRLGYLRLAVRELRDHVVACSPVYQTPPWGLEDQPAFLNAVVIADAPYEPMDWLRRAHEIEALGDRRRETHWGPRTLDVDVITVDDVVSDDPVLTLPHPFAHERAFVLAPWVDLAPEATLPGRGRIADLIARADRAGIERWGSLVGPE